MTVLWLAALSRLSADPNVIFDLRTKIRDQIAAVATWKPGSPILKKFSPSISGNLRVAWTGTIPFKEIPDTDVLVYFVETTNSVNIARHGTTEADGQTHQETDDVGKLGKPISSLSEVFIDCVDADRGLGLFSTDPRAQIEMAAAALGAAALHEAMHNKIGQAKGEVLGKFDLHRHGGGGVASKSIKGTFELVSLNSDKFKIVFTATNRHLWDAHMGLPVKQEQRGSDHTIEVGMFR